MFNVHVVGLVSVRVKHFSLRDFFTYFCCIRWIRKQRKKVKKEKIWTFDTKLKGYLQCVSNVLTVRNYETGSTQSINQSLCLNSNRLCFSMLFNLILWRSWYRSWARSSCVICAESCRRSGARSCSRRRGASEKF